jgi:hypothetical protein
LKKPIPVLRAQHRCTWNSDASLNDLKLCFRRMPQAKQRIVIIAAAFVGASSNTMDLTNQFPEMIFASSFRSDF